MASKGEYLDRTEVFAEWLEEKRRLTGMTQKELAALGGYNYNSYTKLVTLRTLRQRYGDESRQLVAPRHPKTLIGILRVLSERLGEDCVAEGLRVWGHTYVPERGIPSVRLEATEAEKLVGDMFPRLLRLTPDRLKLVDDLVRQLQ